MVRAAPKLGSWAARVLLGAAAWSAPQVASAQAPESGDLRLTWAAPAGCPAGDDVRSAALRGVDRSRMLPGTLVAEATVDSISTPPSATSPTATTTWRVRLRTRRGENTGERIIEGPTCAGVGDATAVVLALALVPPDTIEAPPPPPPVAPPRPVAPAPPARAAPEAGPFAHHIAVGVEAAGVLGALPKLGAGGAVDLAFTLGALRVEAEGRILGTQRATASGKASGADFSLTSVGGRACWAIVRGTVFDVAPCLGMSIESMSTTSVRTDDNLSESAAWASFAGGVMGRYFLMNWLALRARVDAVVPIGAPRFVVKADGVEDLVFKQPTLGAAGYFGAEVLFL